MLFLSLSELRNIDLPVDGVELRMDLFSSIDSNKIAQFCQHCRFPLIFTLRKKSQGGNFMGSENERLKIIESLLEYAPDFIDLEYDIDPNFVGEIRKRFPKTKIILSYHNFENTPQDLDAILLKMQKIKADVYKIATFANSSLDALRMLLFVKRHQNLKITGLCMGEYGEITRILGKIYGNFINYASCANKKTALGQIEASFLISNYNYKSLSSRTQVYGLIGNPVDKSISHRTHNTLMRHYGLNAVYVKIPVKKEELREFLSLAKELGLKGLSVTMPLKEDAFDELDVIDSETRDILAVNTIKFENGKSYGFNTDGKGALNALEEKKSVKGKRIALIGAGGAAKAIASEAKKRGACLVIINRCYKKAEALALLVNASALSLSQNEMPDFDVLINATPVDFSCEKAVLNQDKIVMDIKTLPMMNPFLQKAQEKEASIVFGYEMFLHQAILQFQIWFNVNVDKAFFNELCLKNLNSHLE